MDIIYPSENLYHQSLIFNLLFLFLFSNHWRCTRSRLWGPPAHVLSVCLFCLMAVSWFIKAWLWWWIKTTWGSIVKYSIVWWLWIIKYIRVWWIVLYSMRMVMVNKCRIWGRSNTDRSSQRKENIMVNKGLIWGSSIWDRSYHGNDKIWTSWQVHWKYFFYRIEDSMLSLLYFLTRCGSPVFKKPSCVNSTNCQTHLFVIHYI